MARRVVLDCHAMSWKQRQDALIQILCSADKRILGSQFEQKCIGTIYSHLTTGRFSFNYYVGTSKSYKKAEDKFEFQLARHRYFGGNDLFEKLFLGRKSRGLFLEPNTYNFEKIDFLLVDGRLRIIYAIQVAIEPATHDKNDKLFWASFGDSANKFRLSQAGEVPWGPVPREHLVGESVLRDAIIQANMVLAGSGDSTLKQPYRVQFIWWIPSLKHISSTRSTSFDKDSWFILDSEIDPEFWNITAGAGEDSSDESVEMAELSRLRQRLE